MDLINAYLFAEVFPSFILMASIMENHLLFTGMLFIFLLRFHLSVELSNNWLSDVKKYIFPLSLFEIKPAQRLIISVSNSRFNQFKE